MNIVERRKYRRYAVYCPIEYKREDDSFADSCVTLNLSESGALISTKKPISLAARIIIKITLRGEVFFVRAKVIHVELEQDGNVYNFGVEFTQNAFSFIRRYYEEMEALMLYQRECSKNSGRQVTLSEASVKWYSEPR